MMVAGSTLISASAGAAVVGGYDPRTVTEVFSYTDYSGGDVTFKVNSPIAGCEGGFWLRPSDPGFKTTYAALLMAYSSKATVRVWAYSDQIWSGSGSPTCRLYLLSPAG